MKIEGKSVKDVVDLLLSVGMISFSSMTALELLCKNYLDAAAMFLSAVGFGFVFVMRAKDKKK